MRNSWMLKEYSPVIVLGFTTGTRGEPWEVSVTPGTRDMVNKAFKVAETYLFRTAPDDWIKIEKTLKKPKK